MISDLMVDGLDWVVDPLKCKLRDEVAHQQSCSKGQRQPNIGLEKPKCDSISKECDVEADYTALLKKALSVELQLKNV